jgi:hypothetical protein
LSADNFYLIRKDQAGKYVPVMGFASADDDYDFVINPGSTRRFDTLGEALDWACDQYTEYGVSIHPECGDDE